MSKKTPKDKVSFLIRPEVNELLSITSIRYGISKSQIVEDGIKIRTQEIEDKLNRK